MRIQLVPNTGHQYIFIPLRIADQNRANAAKSARSRIGQVDPEWAVVDAEQRIMTGLKWVDAMQYLVFPQAIVTGVLGPKAEQNILPWMSYQDRGGEGRIIPWVRYRYGSACVDLPGVANKVDIVGIWVAIETNIGGPRRGYELSRPRVDPRHQKAFEQARDQGGVANPYPAAIIESLPASTTLVFSERVDAADKGGQKFVFAVLVIDWQPIRGDPIDVDLVIDFGNTRTLALVLEQAGDGGGNFATMCRPVLFGDEDFSFGTEPWKPPDRGLPVFESWFVLRETAFPQFDLKSSEYATASSRGYSRLGNRVPAVTAVIERRPHVFAQFANVVLGEGAARLQATLMAVAGAGKTGNSSPKRYAWDTEPLRIDWEMVRQPWTNAGRALAGQTLDGEYLHLSLQDRENDGGAEHRPYRYSHAINSRFARADCITWTALAILERAYQQVNSPLWFRDHPPGVQRQIRSVQVTFPSGWTAEELNAYRARWEDGLAKFAITHHHDMPPPELRMDLDEGVAAQLPIVYSEIERLTGPRDVWLDLVGSRTSRRFFQSARRDQPAQGDRPALTPLARVISIDIGGGTTDTAVVDYHGTPGRLGVALHCSVLFRDSWSTGGDYIVKEVIERVLLPMLCHDLASEPAREACRRQMHIPDRPQPEKERWNSFTRLIFVPIVHYWLSRLSMERPEPMRPVEDIPGVQDLAITRLNAEVGVPVINPGSILNPDPAALNDTVAAAAKHILDSQPIFVGGLDVDLVIVTGKPSELPQVKRVVLDELPIPSSRIIFAKDYPSGLSLPLARDRKLKDAKMTTAIGAALYRAMDIPAGPIALWSVVPQPAEKLRSEYHWGLITYDAQNIPTWVGTWLRPGETANRNPIWVPPNAYVGRKLHEHGVPEQVYWLRPEATDERIRNVRMPREVGIFVRRVPDDASPGREALALERVTLPDGFQFPDNAPPLDVIKLKLRTFPENKPYWLDDGWYTLKCDHCRRQDCVHRS